MWYGKEGREGFACCLSVDVENLNAECLDDGLFYVGLMHCLHLVLLSQELCLCSIIDNLGD